MSLDNLFLTLKGGVGSGNIGHAGIPGHRGGSAPKGNFPFLSIETLNDHYKLDELCKKMREECSSVRNYTFLGYSVINSHLRKGGDGAELRKITDIDKFIEKAPRVPEDMMVIRGIKSKELFDKLTPGVLFEDKAFVSTSADPRAEIATDKGMILEIKVPKGSKGIYVEKISDHAYERELLLPRGSKFKVISAGSRRTVLELVNE